MSKTRKNHKNNSKESNYEYSEHDPYVYKLKKKQINTRQNKHFNNALRSRDINKMMQYDDQ